MIILKKKNNNKIEYLVTFEYYFTKYIIKTSNILLTSTH